MFRNFDISREVLYSLISDIDDEIKQRKEQEPFEAMLKQGITLSAKGKELEEKARANPQKVYFIVK